MTAGLEAMLLLTTAQEFDQSTDVPVEPGAEKTKNDGNQTPSATNLRAIITLQP